MQRKSTTIKNLGSTLLHKDNPLLLVSRTLKAIPGFIPAPKRVLSLSTEMLPPGNPSFPEKQLSLTTKTVPQNQGFTASQASLNTPPNPAGIQVYCASNPGTQNLI